MIKEHGFESPEGTEYFVTLSCFAKIYCYVEDVQDDKAFLQKCMFSFCFYGRILLFEQLNFCIGRSSAQNEKGNGIKT